MSAALQTFDDEDVVVVQVVRFSDDPAHPHLDWRRRDLVAPVEEILEAVEAVAEKEGIPLVVTVDPDHNELDLQIPTEVDWGWHNRNQLPRERQIAEEVFDLLGGKVSSYVE